MSASMPLSAAWLSQRTWASSGSAPTCAAGVFGGALVALAESAGPAADVAAAGGPAATSLLAASRARKGAGTAKGNKATNPHSVQTHATTPMHLSVLAPVPTSRLERL